MSSSINHRNLQISVQKPVAKKVVKTVKKPVTEKVVKTVKKPVTKYIPKTKLQAILS